MSGDGVSISAATGGSITVTGLKDGTDVITASLAWCDNIATNFTMTRAGSSIAIKTNLTKTEYTISN